MADPAVEHVEQGQRTGAIGRHRHGRRGHGGRDGIVGGHAVGDHARAQVAIGEDPEPIHATLDDDARRPGRGHALRRRPDRRVRRADHERAAHECLHRLVGRVGRLLAGLAQAPAIQQRARQVAQRLGPSQVGRATSAGIRRQVVSSCARAVKPAGRPDSIEACPKSSPTPSRSSVRPSRTSSTAPLRTTRRWLTGSAPCEKIVVPAGWFSSSAAAATRATSSSPSASNGG